MDKTIEQLLDSIKKDSPTPRANFQNIVEILKAINGKVYSVEEIEEVATTLIEGAESGTIEDALGLDSNGKLVKGAVSGGSKLFMHTVTKSGTPSKTVILINNSSTQITSASLLNSALNSSIMAYYDTARYPIIRTKYDGATSTLTIRIIEISTSNEVSALSYTIQGSVTDVVTEI